MDHPKSPEGRKMDEIKYVVMNYCRHECPGVSSDTCRQCPILHSPVRMRDHGER